MTTDIDNMNTNQLIDYIKTKLKSIDKKLEKFEMESKEICSICLRKVGFPYVKTVCEHIFHQRCLDLWMNIHSNCPMCRTFLTNYKKYKQPRL